MNFTKALSIAVTPVEIAVTLILGSFPAPYRNSRDSRDPGNHRLTMMDRSTAGRPLGTPDVMGLKFLVGDEKDRHIFLLRGGVLHGHALQETQQNGRFPSCLDG